MSGWWVWLNNNIEIMNMIKKFVGNFVFNVFCVFEEFLNFFFYFSE